jgi:signal transduction histidine kinase
MRASHDTAGGDLPLLEQTLRLQLDIVRHMPLGLLVWRPDDGAIAEFRLVTANPAASALAGRDLDALVGARLAEIFPGAPGAALVARLTTPQAGAHVDERDIAGLSSDPSRLFAVDAFALPERLIAMTIDEVTARREVEQRLRQAEKMETVWRLAGGIAHDFNNVLTTIAGTAAVLDDTLAAGDPRREDVGDIAEAARRGAALTRRLLAFSRRRAADVRRLDLNEEIGGLAPLLRRLLGAGIELRLQLAPGLPAIVADATEIEQVLLNLVVNARQAMPEGGRLDVRTEWAGRADAGNPGVVLVVADTGSGMDERTRARIFEPFFTTRDEGTGLGLATVYRIVEQRGGAIDVASRVGEGTTFTVRFPAQQARPATCVAPHVAGRTPDGGST